MTVAYKVGEWVGERIAALEESAGSLGEYLEELADGIGETAEYAKLQALSTYGSQGPDGAAARTGTYLLALALTGQEAADIDWEQEVNALLSGDIDLSLFPTAQAELGGDAEALDYSGSTDGTVDDTTETVNETTVEDDGGTATDDTVNETEDTIEETQESVEAEVEDAYDDVEEELPDELQDRTPDDPIDGNESTDGNETPGNDTPENRGNETPDDQYQPPGNDSPQENDPADPAGGGSGAGLNDSGNGSVDAVAADPSGSGAAGGDGSSDLLYTAAGLAGAGALAAGGYAAYRAAQEEEEEEREDDGDDEMNTGLRDRSDDGRSLSRGSTGHLRNRRGD